LIDLEIDLLVIEVKDSYFMCSTYQTWYSCIWW